MSRFQERVSGARVAAAGGRAPDRSAGRSEAIAEGRRYQTLSIVSFSLAGAMAVGAAVWFALDRGEQLTVAPVVAPGSAGISTTVRF